MAKNKLPSHDIASFDSSLSASPLNFSSVLLYVCESEPMETDLLPLWREAVLALGLTSFVWLKVMFNWERPEDLCTDPVFKQASLSLTHTNTVHTQEEKCAAAN